MCICVCVYYVYSKDIHICISAISSLVPLSCPSVRITSHSSCKCGSTCSNALSTSPKASPDLPVGPPDLPPDPPPDTPADAELFDAELFDALSACLTTVRVYSVSTSIAAVLSSPMPVFSHFSVSSASARRPPA